MARSAAARPLVRGRIKALGSTWLKAQVKRRSVDSIHDLVGVHVIVDEVDECYAVEAGRAARGLHPSTQTQRLRVAPRDLRAAVVPALRCPDQDPGDARGVRARRPGPLALQATSARRRRGAGALDPDPALVAREAEASRPVARQRHGPAGRGCMGSNVFDIIRRLLLQQSPAPLRAVLVASPASMLSCAIILRRGQTGRWFSRCSPADHFSPRSLVRKLRVTFASSPYCFDPTNSRTEVIGDASLMVKPFSPPFRYFSSATLSCSPRSLVHQ